MVPRVAASLCLRAWARAGLDPCQGCPEVAALGQGYRCRCRSSSSKAAEKASAVSSGCERTTAKIILAV